MTNSESRTQRVLLDAELSLEIAVAYAKIYSAPPWKEDWTVGKAMDELMEVIAKERFVGLVKRIDGELVAFSWGYPVPRRNTSRVDFVKIRMMLSKQCLDPNNAFYGAETAVFPEYRKRGIATMLIKERARLAGSETILFRTKNQQIVRIWRTVFGGELFSFPEESAYEDGRVYVFWVKK